MNLPKFGENKFCNNTKKNILHFFTFYISKSHNTTKYYTLFSLRIHDGSKAYHGFEIM